MRTHYNNGDEIELKHCGCDGCNPCMINGVLCHERSCPYAWKDEKSKDWYYENRFENSEDW